MSNIFDLDDHLPQTYDNIGALAPEFGWLNALNNEQKEAVKNKLGENFMIIGLPNELFGPHEAKSEIVVFMVPRLIKTVKTSEDIKNNI